VIGARQLRPCGRGSCVSSQAPLTDPTRRIEPLPFAGSTKVALRAVLTVLARVPRARVLERDDASVHAVIRSAVLRVPLDLEIVVAPGSEGSSSDLHLRAATPLALRERSTSRVRAQQLLDLIDRELRASV
jgi:uncharacterized protein (DUF1499 family)